MSGHSESLHGRETPSLSGLSHLHGKDVLFGGQSMPPAYQLVPGTGSVLTAPFLHTSYIYMHSHEDHLRLSALTLPQERYFSPFTFMAICWTANLLGFLCPFTHIVSEGVEQDWSKR